MIFHCSLSDTKPLQEFRILLWILVFLKNVLVGVVSTCLLIYKSSSPFINPCWLYWSHYLQVVSLSLSCSIFFHFSSKIQVLIFLFALSQNCKIIIYFLEFFSSALADDISLGFKREQVSSCLQDSSSVFWPFSIMKLFGWSPLVRQLPHPLFPFSNSLITVPKAPITIVIIVTYMFHSFFNSLARSRYVSFFSHSFSLILWSAGTEKSTILQFLFFFIDYD